MGIILNCELCGNLSHSNRKPIEAIFERGILSASTGATMCLHKVRVNLPLVSLPLQQIIKELISDMMIEHLEWPFHNILSY